MKFLAVAFSCLLGSVVPACAQAVSLTNASGFLKLGDRDVAPVIWIASNEFAAVVRVTDDLATDFGRVLGRNATVKQTNFINNTNVRYEDAGYIIAGTVGNSTLIDGLVKQGALDVRPIRGQWESYIQQIVIAPALGIPWALVVAGSDRRGTIYGLYDIAETMGVSPWYYWADVPVKPQSAVYASPTRQVKGPPSVKYRGIFINDEESCLTAWAKAKFTISKYNSPFTKEFYKLVFELLLRLKANYLWPAMKYSMFYVDDEDNGLLADTYGIVMGTSHTEPMSRATDEQTRFLTGNWDWETNSDNVEQFMQAGANRSKTWETLYTMGMRGAGDTESPTLTAQQLEEIIGLQQQMITSTHAALVEDVPQAWALYKEVGRYYQAGMNVSDIVTLLWTDDNYGNLLRVPFSNETSRNGGAGVYYHANYVGRPRNYNWINTIQLIKQWEQFHLAYERQARQIWVLNVGDIKPMEVPLSHAMSMAYDMTKHDVPSSVTDFLQAWATQQFGSSVAHATADILNQYGLLVMRRKYEALNLEPFVYSTMNYDEAWVALSEWENLLALAQTTYNTLDDVYRTAFYQTVLHPVLAGKTVTELYIKVFIGKLYQAERRTSTNTIATEARNAYVQDANITAQYNAINGGKWNGIMCQPHINFVTWYQPSKNSLPSLSYMQDSLIPTTGIMGAAVEGSNLASLSNTSDLVMLPVDPYMPANTTRWLDIFTRANGTFSYEIRTNVSYISVTNHTGTLAAPGNTSDVRSRVDIDWEKAPDGLSLAALYLSRTDNVTANITIHLPVNKTKLPSNFNGYVESDGTVAIEASHYSQAGSSSAASYVELPYYGRTLSGIMLWPVNVSTQDTNTGPQLTYKFYSFTDRDANASNLMLHFGGSRNFDETRPLKYAYSIDDSRPVICQPVPAALMGSDPEGWNGSVVTGGWNQSTQIATPINQGGHSLNLWLLEPGLVLQKVIIDFGGMRAAAKGPPESYKQ